MSQYDFGTIDPNVKNGTGLAGDLNSWRDALNTTHLGVARPAYAQAGMLWIDNVSASQWDLRVFDGTNDITLRSVDPGTSSPYPFGLGDGGTGGTDAPSARTSLGLGDVAIENIVPVNKGGTGASVASTARTNLGLGDVAVESIVPVAKGGTGAATAAAARTNLGLGTAAVADLGAAIGNALEVIDVGGSNPGLPAIDGSNLLNVGLQSSVSERDVLAGSGNWIVPAGITKIRVIVGGGGAGASGVTSYANGTQSSFNTTVIGSGGAGMTGASLKIVNHGGGSGGDVTLVGGGGEGGFVSQGGSPAMGGNGGLTIATLAVTPGQSIPYSVGAGGGGSSTGQSGFIFVDY